MRKRLISILMGVVLLFACAASPVKMTPEQQSLKEQEIERLEKFLEPSYPDYVVDEMVDMLSETYDLFMTQPVIKYGNNESTKQLLKEAYDITKKYDLKVIGLEMRVQVHQRNCSKRILYHIVFGDGSHLVVIFSLDKMQGTEPVCEDNQEITL